MKRLSALPTILVLLALLVSASLAPSSAAAPLAPEHPLAPSANASWSPAAPMNAVRAFKPAVMLQDGRVLVAGGRGNSPIGHQASAEIYSPATNTWKLTKQDMLESRAMHTMILLPTGEVFVAGGWNGVQALDTAELYNPTTDTWASAGTMSARRAYHMDALLPGAVLIIGGGNGAATNEDQATTDIYNWGTGLWRTGATMSTPRANAKAVVLTNGKVLVAAGYNGSVDLDTYELYNPANDTWSPAAGMPGGPREGYQAVSLGNGKVLIAGGRNGSLPKGSRSLATAVLYDPKSDSWSPAGSMSVGRNLFLSARLPGGKVLVAGGLGSNGTIDLVTLTSAEIYDPATNAWTPTASMSVPRFGDTETPIVLNTGQVLVAGGGSGSASSGNLSACELYTSGQFLPGPNRAYLPLVPN